MEVKNEKEASFEINLDEIESKVSSNQLKVRECRVILEDFNKNTQNKRFKDSAITKNEVNDAKDNPQKNKKELKPGTVECRVCGTIMLKGSILSHIRQFHPEQTKSFNFFCEICDLKFHKMVYLKIHMTHKHGKSVSGPKHYECDFDGKVFETRARLRNHMVYHQPKVNCEFCQIEVLPTALQRHITNIHKNERKFQCQICQKSFKLDYSLKLHIQNHNKTFECQTCSRKFPTQGILKKHVKDNHENPKSFGCDICGKKFYLKSTLYRNKKIHDKNRLKPYKCQRCGYSTDSKRNFKLHKKGHEKRDKKFAAMKNPLKCGKCSTLCRNKYALKSHVKDVHPEVPFQCDLCGKYFNTKHNLAMHIKNRICNKSLWYTRAT